MKRLLFLLLLLLSASIAEARVAGEFNFSVNGVECQDVDADDSTPSAPANSVNIKWQKDTNTPCNLSGNLLLTLIDGIGLSVSGTELIVETTEIGTTTWGSGSAIVWTFDAGATDPVWTIGSNSMDLTTGVLKYGGNTVGTSANKLSFFSATTSSELLGVISDETGSGLLVFGTSPIISTSLTTNAADSADTGFFRFGNNESICWELATPGTDKCLVLNTSDKFVFGGNVVDFFNNSVTVLPDAGASNNFLTAISTSGVISKAQPSFSNLSGSAGASQGGTGISTSASTGVPNVDAGTWNVIPPTGRKSQLGVNFGETDYELQTWENTVSLKDEFCGGYAFESDTILKQFDSPVSTDAWFTHVTEGQILIESLGCKCIGTCTTVPTVKFCKAPSYEPDIADDTCTINMLDATETTTVSCSATGVTIDNVLNQPMLITGDTVSMVVANTPSSNSSALMFFMTFKKGGTLGDLGWNFSFDNSTINANTTNEPCWTSMETSATTNNLASVWLGTRVGNGPWWISSTDKWVMSASIDPSDTTSALLQFGLLSDPLDTTPTNGIYFNWDTSVENQWHCITRASDVQTNTDSNTTADSSRVELKIVKDGSTVTFYKDGTLICTNSTNIPSDQVAYPAFQIQTLTTAMRKINLGAWEYRGDANR